MQFGDDWPGIFIRGDSALHYALTLDSVIEASEKGRPLNSIEVSYCKNLVNLLKEAAVGRDEKNSEVQLLLDFNQAKK
jgi:hypothetical protein